MHKYYGYGSELNFDEAILSKGPARLKELTPHQHTIHPYNCIGLVIAYIYGQPARSTGTLIASNIVLTTAHSVLFVSDEN